jgi:hypothetical protein
MMGLLGLAFCFIIVMIQMKFIGLWSGKEQILLDGALGKNITALQVEESQRGILEVIISTFFSQLTRNLLIPYFSLQTWDPWNYLCRAVATGC